ncbi:hypothetical protein SAMN05216355_101301, partial [Actinomyces ruminicola]
MKTGKTDTRICSAEDACAPQWSPAMKTGKT